MKCRLLLLNQYCWFLLHRIAIQRIIFSWMSNFYSVWVEKDKSERERLCEFEKNNKRYANKNWEYLYDNAYSIACYLLLQSLLLLLRVCTPDINWHQVVQSEETHSVHTPIYWKLEKKSNQIIIKRLSVRWTNFLKGQKSKISTSSDIRIGYLPRNEIAIEKTSVHEY